MNARKRALVIGGNGLLGYGILIKLAAQKWMIRNLDIREANEHMRIKGVEYVVGSMFDEAILAESLKNIDVVFYFISNTIPKSNDENLSNEISKTLIALDYMLHMMVKNSVQRIIFPSSGGAVYGEMNDGFAKETDVLVPKTAYGTGKLLCENVLGFYHQKYGIKSLIFRIGNVYGSPLFRDKQQGVVDVFIQNVLDEKPITIWGNASSVVRDYVFLDDVANAIEMAARQDYQGVNVFNVGTGVGTTTLDIIECLCNKLDEKPIINYDPSTSSGINRIVLDIGKIQKAIGWKPRYDLSKGITETIEMKRDLMWSGG